MFLAGDEFLNTQFGNNNAYCQDNEISWLDWDDLKKNREHFEYVKHLIRIRQTHDVIRRFSGNCSMRYPEIQVMEPDSSTRVLRVMYAGRNSKNTGDDLVLLAINVFWEPQEFYLPDLPHPMEWFLEADSAKTVLPGGIPTDKGAVLIENCHVRMEPRSTMVLIAKTHLANKGG